ncbi:MAG: T9SS type A sorting domain-containing protein, partial [Bacteroidota bacterium]
RAPVPAPQPGHPRSGHANNSTALPILGFHRRWLILIVCFLMTAFSASAQLILNTRLTELEDNAVRVDFIVHNFDRILTMQHSISWNTEAWAFRDIIAGDLPGVDRDILHTNLTEEEGRLGFIWMDLSGLNGETRSDGTIIYTLIFDKRSELEPALTFTDYPIPIEITTFENNSFVDISLTSITNAVVGRRQVYGQIFQDENNNCTFEQGEIPLNGWSVEAKSEQHTRRVEVLDDGRFVMPLDNNLDYTIQAIPPLDLWELCQSSYIIAADANASAELPFLQFGATTVQTCPLLTVSVSTPFLRRCFENAYDIQYENVGTADATDTYVQVQLDDALDFNRASIPSTDLGDNLFQFDLGDLAVSERGKFKLYATVNCEAAELGQTHCTKATIFPFSDCLQAPDWSEAELAIHADCIDEETIAFTVKNVGLGDMLEEQAFTIVEGMIMLYENENQQSQTFRLRSNEALMYELPANGKTYRLETAQVPNHPFYSPLGITLEGCGEDETGDFERGIVTMLPQRGRASNQDIDCQENRGSYDPNDKQAFPKGYGEENWLKQNTDIEYVIRFQNTGTDTAFNIVVLDTLSSFLNASSVRPLVASHDYQFELLDEKVLKFTFPNIMLPDSNINEPASHGYIRFQVEQVEDLADDLILENRAAIYFDFNEPIITNTVRHRLGKEFIPVLNINRELLHSQRASASPNPFSDHTLLEFPTVLPANSTLHLYNMLGVEVQQTTVEGNTYWLERGALRSGTYFYLVKSKSKVWYNGHLVLQDLK